MRGEYYCCESLHAKVREGVAAVNLDGSIDLSSIYHENLLEEDLPYCPWCGTKLLKEKEDA